MRRLVPALACLAWLGLPNAAASADGLMLIQAGAFWMGRDGGPPEEAPLHRVFVTDFWIERHKVTNAEFAEFLDGRGPWSGEGRIVVRGASHDDPAEELSLTRRRSYDRRGASAGHHFVGFRCATSEDLGGY